MPASRRPVTIAAAIATATALGATALALPAVAADAKPPASLSAEQVPQAANPAAYKLEQGTLEWGFKESFRTYVGAEGIKAADGAEQAAGNGAFTFTEGTGGYDPATHELSTSFRGTVEFTAKRFTLKVSDVRLVGDRASGTIRADVTVDGETREDIPVAALDLAKSASGEGDGGAMVFKDIPATLTADGAAAFRYPEGEILDTATFSVKPVKPVTGGEPTGPGEPGQPEQPEQPGTGPGPDKPAAGDTTGGDSGRNTTAAGALVDGDLHWGVVKRFRDYIAKPFVKGKVELTGGAVKSGEIYRFTKAKGSFDAAKKTLNASFDGKLRFLGHPDKDTGVPALDLSFSGFEVKVNGTRGTLIADVVTNKRDNGKRVEYPNAELIAFTVPSGGLKAENNVVKLANAPAKLTAAGAKAIEGYEVNQQMDPVTVAVALTKDAQLPATSGGSSTGGTTGTTTGGTTGGTVGTTTGGTTGGTVGGTTGGTVGGPTGGTTGGTVGGGGSLASTGSGLPAGALLAAAGGVAAAGAAVVFAVRRRENAPE